MAKGFKCGSGSDKIMKLLWENASPTSAFAAQTISLDLSQYDAVFIVLKFSADYNWKVNVFLRVGDADSRLGGDRVGGKYYFRETTVNTNGIVFTGCYYAVDWTSNVQEDNKVIIPWFIYGIKGVS